MGLSLSAVTRLTNELNDSRELIEMAEHRNLIQVERQSALRWPQRPLNLMVVKR